jgi:hypothetical protein
MGQGFLTCELWMSLEIGLLLQGQRMRTVIQKIAVHVLGATQEEIVVDLQPHLAMA